MKLNMVDKIFAGTMVVLGGTAVAITRKIKKIDEKQEQISVVEELIKEFKDVDGKDENKVAEYVEKIKSETDKYLEMCK